jgi:predicted nucleotidyltransferase component of viral defense system
LEATTKVQKSIVALLKGIFEKYGEVKVRWFGDVVSIDLLQGKKVVFNFQIAKRSVLLRPTILSPWTDISLNSLDDLVASKMTALIERGAPRDFVDIYTICDKKLVT